MMTDIPEQDFFTPKEVQEMLKVHKVTLYRWLRPPQGGGEPAMRSVKAGRARRIPRQALLEFLENSADTED